MPTYSYKCRSCDYAFDIRQAFTDDSLTECPECSGSLRKLFDKVGVVFKGSGFYRTDSRQGEGSDSGSSEKSSSGSGSSESSGSGSNGSGSSTDSGSGSGSSGSGSSDSGGSGSNGSSQASSSVPSKTPAKASGS